MAQDIAGLVLGRDQGRQIGCHAGIVVMVRPGRDAVIAHVGRDHWPAIRQIPGDPAPVPGRAEQAMRDDKRARGPRALADRVKRDGTFHTPASASRRQQCRDAGMI